MMGKERELEQMEKKEIVKEGYVMYRREKMR